MLPPKNTFEIALFSILEHCVYCNTSEESTNYGRIEELTLFIVVGASGGFLLLITIGSIIYCKYKEKCCFASRESYQADWLNSYGHGIYNTNKKVYNEDELPKRTSRMSFKKFTKVDSATEFPLHRQTEFISLSSNIEMPHTLENQHYNGNFPMSRI